MDAVATGVLTGQTEHHLCSAVDAERLGARVHCDVVAPLLRLRHEASAGGFDLRVLSGFRSFERQLSIWNRKVTGRLPVLDDAAVPVDITTLGKRDLVFAILRWSALPGASRHHWGTDLDVYDRGATPERYEIQLIPEEVDDGGMFGPLHRWLDARMSAGSAFGFFRPYDYDRRGVAPERWHLSYAPVATQYERCLTPSVLADALRPEEMALKDVVLAHLDEIFRRFVTNTGRPST